MADTLSSFLTFPGDRKDRVAPQIPCVPGPQGPSSKAQRGTQASSPAPDAQLLPSGSQRNSVAPTGNVCAQSTEGACGNIFVSDILFFLTKSFIVSFYDFILNILFIFPSEF